MMREIDSALQDTLMLLEQNQQVTLRYTSADTESELNSVESRNTAYNPSKTAYSKNIFSA